MKYQRARIPPPPVFNYKIRPVSAVEAKEQKVEIIFVLHFVKQRNQVTCLSLLETVILEERRKCSGHTPQPHEGGGLREESACSDDERGGPRAEINLHSELIPTIPSPLLFFFSSFLLCLFVFQKRRRSETPMLTRTKGERIRLDFRFFITM